MNTINSHPTCTARQMCQALGQNTYDEHVARLGSYDCAFAAIDMSQIATVQPLFAAFATECNSAALGEYQAGGKINHPYQAGGKM